MAEVKKISVNSRKGHRTWLDKDGKVIKVDEGTKEPEKKEKAKPKKGGKQ